MRESLKSVAVVTASVLAISSMASAAYLTVDFESDTVGSAPASASSVGAPANTEVRVIDSGSTPADPFGGAGNQSLFMRDDSESLNAEATWKGVGPGLTSGTFTIQYLLQDGGNTSGGYADNPYMNIRLGDTAGGSTLSGIGPWIDQNGTSLRNLADSSIFDQVPLLNAVNTLTLAFDTATDTFTGTLNSAALTTGGSPLNTVHPFTSLLSSIDGFYAGAAWSSPYDVHFFMDNAELDAIPEPASIGLIVGAGAMMLRRRSR
jgi:hypothetical protein